MVEVPHAAPPVDERVKIERVIHTIHAVRNITACRARYLDVLGGLIFAESYFAAEDRDMALLYVANHMIEPMAPRDPDDLEQSFAKYVKRYGEGFHSFEVKVADARGLGERLKRDGFRLATDYGFFFFIRPESSGGVMVEVCETAMPNDPFDRRNWRSDWAEGVPSSVLRVDHLVCVVSELEAAIRLFTLYMDGEVLEDRRIELPGPGRRVLLRLGDTLVAFLQPDLPASGALGDFVARANSGVYAIVWSVEDEARAAAFFMKQGLRVTQEGCVSAGFAIDPRDFMGARHEFLAVT